MALFYSANKRDSVSRLKFSLFLTMSSSFRVTFRQLVVWNVHNIVIIFFTPCEYFHVSWCALHKSLCDSKSAPGH